MSVRSPLQLYLCTVALLATFQSASADCRDDSICVTAIDQDGSVGLHARNLREYPITFTLRMHNRGLVVNGASTVTHTLAPLKSEQIMVLGKGGKQDDTDYRYSLDWTIGDMNAVHDDDHLYALPYSSGQSYRVIQGFGSRFSHTGLEEFAIDFDMGIGTAVHAARSGVVAHVEESHSKGCWDDGCGKFANFVVILHSDGTTGEYYHLQKDGVIVNVGDQVVQGQKIAYSGNTGHTTMPHLHFAVYRAADWGSTQSLPVRFVSADGIIDRVRRGARHQAQ